jgi:hypothetical protein
MALAPLPARPSSPRTQAFPVVTAKAPLPNHAAISPTASASHPIPRATLKMTFTLPHDKG